MANKTLQDAKEKILLAQLMHEMDRAEDFNKYIAEYWDLMHRQRLEFAAYNKILKREGKKPVPMANLKCECATCK